MKVLKNRLFVACSTGMEAFLCEELQELGFSSLALKSGFRGVEVLPDFQRGYERSALKHTMQSIYKINYCSRLAERVYLPLVSILCRNREELFDGVQRFAEWNQFLTAEKSFSIVTNGQSTSELNNKLFVSQVIKDAICDQFSASVGKRPFVSKTNPDVIFNAFMAKVGEKKDDKLVKITISLDTSGSPLFKRGYKHSNGDAVLAPLRETLAAGILRMISYGRPNSNKVIPSYLTFNLTSSDTIQNEMVKSNPHNIQLMDPCCGSGTFLIEAAMISTNTPAGFLRRNHPWGFQNLPWYSPIEWNHFKEHENEKIHLVNSRMPQIFGLDKNQEAIDLCAKNVMTAGFQELIHLKCVDWDNFNCMDYPIPCPNLVLCNPPYGIRLSCREVGLLPLLYRSLGNFLKKKTTKPAKAYILVEDLQLVKYIGLRPKKRHIIMNGGLECRLLEYDLY